jgi:hypothetical protein
MAVWQFDLDFEHGADGRDLSAATVSVVIASLTETLGPSRPMLVGWRYFGDKDGNRLDVVEETDGSAQVQARLDARASDTDTFIGHVCAAATAAGCSLVSDELRATIEPTSVAVKEAVQRSTAWRFALDPGSFKPEL